MKRTLIAALLVLLVPVATCTTAGAQSPTPTVCALPVLPTPGTWRQANPTHETFARAYSGVGWDQTRHRVYYFGGADRSYWGNQISVYDVCANDWSDMFAPDANATYNTATACIGGKLGVDCNQVPVSGGKCPTTPTGHPWVRHTDGLSAYAGPHNLFFIHGGTVGYAGKDGNGNGIHCLGGGDDTWTYDVTNGTAAGWRNVSIAAGDVGFSGAASEIYDPVDDVIVLYGGASGPDKYRVGLYHFSGANAGTWTKPTVGTHPAATWNIPMAWDSKRRLVILTAGLDPNVVPQTTTWSYNVSTNTWTNLNATTTTNCPGHVINMDYDSRNDVFLAYTGGSTPTVTCVYDPTTNRWTQLSPATAPTGEVPRASLVYDVDHNVHILTNIGAAGANYGTQDSPPYPTPGAQTVTWLFQLDPAALTPGAAKTSTGTPKVTPTATPKVTPTAPPNSTPPPSPTGAIPTATATGGAAGSTCLGTVRWVGPTRAYSKPSQAAAVVQSNDCVYIDAGDYPNDVATWPATATGVTIRAVGGMANLRIENGVTAGSKGIWVIDGDNTTVENISFSCASSRTNNTNCSGVLTGDENDAGIRLEAKSLTVRNCKFFDNDNGILGGPAKTNPIVPVGDIVVEHSEFWRNGWGDGQSHNIYLNQMNKTITLRYNWFHGPITGNNVKLRGATNYVLYNRIMDENNGATSCTNPPDCMGSAQLDLPCGGIDYVIGNLFQKGSLADSIQVIKFAAELYSLNPANNRDCTYSLPDLPQELYVINNTIVSDKAGTQFIRGYGTAAPYLDSKNNIFWGAGTAVTWYAGGKVDEAGDVVVDPHLTSQSGYDYHPTSASTAVINQGIDPGTDSHGYSLVPTKQYVYDRGYETRPSDGRLDVGAFEYVADVTPFPTPTASATFTPTNSPVPSPTPAAPQYCTGGNIEAVFPIVVSADNGQTSRNGSAYPPATYPRQTSSSGYNNQYLMPKRQYSGTSYTVASADLRWPTSTRPDGSPWPAGTVLTGAFVRPYWLKGASNADGRTVVWEWHAWVPPLTDADWTATAPAPGDAAYAGASSFTTPQTKGFQTIPLANTNGVSLSGYTGMRVHISGGVPTGGNYVPFYTRDYLTSGGNISVQLILCYTTAPAAARPTPPRILP